MAKLYRGIAALVAWSGLVLQYFLLAKGRHGGALIDATLHFFAYFTVLSNVFAALCLTMPWLAPRSSLGRFCGSLWVRTSVAVYITVTACIYVLVLRDLWAPAGLQWVANVLLHYVTPALFLVDWLMFAPKGALPWHSALTWLLFPVAFAAASLARGRASDFYPYPFIDVSELGLARVLLNMAVLTFVFLGVGLLFVLIHRWLGRTTPSADGHPILS